MIRLPHPLLPGLATAACALFMALTFLSHSFADHVPEATDQTVQSDSVTINGNELPGSSNDHPASPMYLSGSFLSSLMNYVWQGMLHIFIGVDHVLFVTCLALAVGWSGRILWSVTGFTLGHSVTLALGAFGFAPRGSWFAPMIEVTIALSILYAAVIVLQNVWKEQKETVGSKAKWYLFGVTSLIGLVHGYGFSFVFDDLLSGSAQQVTTALAGFNIGVEIGQFIIIAMILAVLAGGEWIWKQAPRWISSGIATGTIAIACVWIVERALVLHETLSPLLSQGQII